mgnify:CR=1 FL=1
MSLVKLNGNPVLGVDRILNDLFNEFPRTWNDPVPGRSFTPAVNIHETADKYHLEMNVPGRKKEDFRINMENGMLTISFEKKEEKESEDKKTIRREFSYQNFRRSFQIDENIDAEGIEAKYDAGVLHILLPKKAEVKERNKNIPIQ